MSRSKRSSKSGGRRPRRPAFAIVLLVLFMATVFWFIVQRQVGSAEERRLRLLAGFADRVEATVGDLGDRFGRVVTERCANQVADYLKLLPQVEYVSSAPADTPCPQDEPQSEAEDGQAGEEEVPPEEPPEGAAERDLDADAPEDPGTGPARPPMEPEPKLTLHSTGPHVRLEYQRNGASGTETMAEPPEEAGHAVGTARARLDLESIIEPMIIPGVFDSILVTNAQGKVLYQHGEPELRVTHLDGLLGTIGQSGEAGLEELASWRTVVERQGGDAGRFLLRLVRLEEDRPAPSPVTGRATTILETRIAGSDHSVFFQPVTLRLSPLPHRMAPQPVQWIAVGVISSEHLLSAGVTTSPILLFLLVSILPLGLVAWPFLKLALISRRQPFTRLDCAFLVVACVLALTFGALFLFDGLFLNNVQKTIDRQLARLSETVHGSFRLEVLDAYGQLDRLNRSAGFSDSNGNVALGGDSGSFDYFQYLEPGSGDGSDARTARTFIESRIGNYLDSAPPRVYPYFDSVFWPDSEGRLEGANLPLREHAVLPQSVSDREYFQCAREWEDPLSISLQAREVEEYRETRDVPAGVELPDGPMQLCLQPFLDRTTGEAVAAVSIQGPERWRAVRPVAALVTRLTSVTQPVLPPEIRFAVVDGEGQVLFHSDSRRALTEDFVKATDEDRLLQSLLHTRREGDLKLHYWGQRHRAYVRPMGDLPWTLIVFRSMEDLRLRNFELIYDFLNPFVLNLAILGLLALAFKVTAPRRFRVTLWPIPDHLQEYRWIVWWTVGWLIVFVLLLAFDPGSPVPLFLASLILVPATFLLVVGVLPALRWYRGKRASAEDPGENGSSTSGSGGESGAKSGPHSVRSWHRSSPWYPWVVGSLLAVGLAAPFCFYLWKKDVMAAWLAFILLVVGLGLWWFRFEFRGKRRKRAYVFALGCLLLLSMLPAVGFLHLARSRQIQFLTQDGTLALAQSVRDRAEEIEERQGPLDYYESYRDTLACTRDGYLRTVFDTEIRASGAGVDAWETCRGEPSAGCTDGRETPWLWPFGQDRKPTGTDDGRGGSSNLLSKAARWLERSTVRTFSARPLALNDLSTRPTGVDLSRFHSTQGRWCRLGQGPRGDLVAFDPAPGAEEGSLPSMASVVPEVGSFSGLKVRRKLLLLLGLTILGGGPFLLSLFLAKKLLLVDLVYYGEGHQESGGEDEGGKNGSENPGSGQVQIVRPGEALDEALDEVRSTRHPVKRLVLVSGQLQREAWQDLVATPAEPDEAAVEEGDGRKDEDGVKKAEDAEDRFPLFWEARFREAWKRVEGGPSAADEQPGGGEGAAKERDEGDTRLPREPSISRAAQFESALVEGSGADQPILVTEFDPELEDPDVAAEQTDALRDLIEHGGRSLVILSETVPARGSGEIFETPDAEAARSRWIELLGSFPVRYTRDVRGAVHFGRLLKGLERYLDKPERREEEEPHQLGHWKRIVRTIRDECRHTPTLRQLGSQLLRELFVDVSRSELQTEIEALKVEVEEQDPDAVTEGEEPSRSSCSETDREAKRKELEAKRKRLRRLEQAWAYGTLLTEDHVITRVGAEARLHYRFLWSQCTRDEKLVLVQLAQNGLVNPKYDGWVLDLMQKGLVLRAPDVRIMNRSFARFVRQETRRSQILEWQDELGPNAWGLLKWILPFPLLALAGFLFITQRDAVSNAAGVLVALVSLTPVVFNLYDKFQEINLRQARAGTDEGED